MTFLQELLLFSCWIMSDSLQHHGLQHARVPCPSLSPRLLKSMSIESVILSNHLILSVFFSLQSFLASGSFPMSRLFASGGQNIGASASASVLPMNIQGWFPWALVWSCRSMDSQASSSAPQFESINSSALSLLYGPALTSLLDYWKNHSFEYMDLF